MSFESQVKGCRTELGCMTKFIEMGFQCSVPYGNFARYDMIIDVDGELLKIQCKTARPVDENIIMIDCKSHNTSGTKYYSAEEIDYFATYWQGNVYLIPVEEVSGTKNLNFSEQLTSIQNRAGDYLVDNILGHKKQMEITDEFTTSQRKTNQCAGCGKPILNTSELCMYCLGLSRRRVERPEREELKMLIRTLPFTKIAQKFDVSDNAIRKWCDKYGLPRKKGDINKISDADWKEI